VARLVNGHREREGILTTVIFVHGTGVREPGFSATFARIGAELHKRVARLEVVPCYWGGIAGARLWRDGISVPSYDTTRAIVAEGEEEEIALWGLLYQDPLWELRLLALVGARGGESSPGQEPPGDVLDTKVRAVGLSGELATAFTAAGLAEAFESARATVVIDQSYRQALATARGDLGKLRLAVARAIVAQALAGQVGPDDVGGLVIPDAVARDRAVVLLTEMLGGGERSTGGVVGAAVRGLVLRSATAVAVRRRGAITDATTPAAGDILLYQARGEAIRGIIAEKIEGTVGPVVLIAHSLGGIAAVDLLAGRAFPQVRLLVTVGSQAPLLYEIGALTSLEHDDPLPGYVLPWLNLYDRRDLLSYLAAPLFPDRATDVEVRNGQPFPQSHSAYWSNPAMWDAIVARLR
jgi:hypothetical protein